MKVQPMPGSSFGAIVIGFNPATGPADPALAAGLASAWSEHGLLVFRGLPPLTPAQHVALSAMFGEVEDMIETKIYAGAGEESKWVHPDNNNIFLVHGRDFARGGSDGGRPDDDAFAALTYPSRQGWHTDQSYRSPPPDGSALYCVTPAAGDEGDTFFSGKVHQQSPLMYPQLCTLIIDA